MGGVVVGDVPLGDMVGMVVDVTLGEIMVVERIGDVLFQETGDVVGGAIVSVVFVELGNKEAKLMTGVGVELEVILVETTEDVDTIICGKGVVELEVETCCTPLLATIVTTRISSLSSAMELRDTEVLLIAITV